MTKKYSKTSKNQTRVYHLLKAILKVIKQLVTARSLNDWTINLSSAFELHKPAIWEILNSMEKQKMIEKFGKDYHKYPYRITDSRIFEAKVFLDSNKRNKITILRLRQYLENFLYLNVLSSIGVRHMLKHILKYTYKRATSLTLEHFLQKGLNCCEKKIIFRNSLNNRIQTNMDWWVSFNYESCFRIQPATKRRLKLFFQTICQ